MRTDQVDGDGDLDPVTRAVMLREESPGVVDQGVEGAGGDRLVGHSPDVV